MNTYSAITKSIGDVIVFILGTLFLTFCIGYLKMPVLGAFIITLPGIFGGSYIQYKML